MNAGTYEPQDKGAHLKARLLDPSRLLSGAVAGIAAFVLQGLVIPPVIDPRVESLENYLVKGAAAASVLVVTWLLPKRRRTLGRIFWLSLPTVIVVGSAVSGSYYFISIRAAVALHREVAHWPEVLNNRFEKHGYFTTAGTDVNGSGNATTGGGVLTLRLRSQHVANQQFFVADVAPAGQEYYVETSVRRQSGPIGSGCFLAFAVVDSNRYFLFEVAEDQRPNRPLHSAQIFQEVQAAPAVQRAVDQTSTLPYVDDWSLLWPPGAYSQWTQLAIYRAGNNYEFFVDDRMVGDVTNLPVSNGRITVGSFDPGTTSGSYVNCQFRYLRAWRK